MARAPERVADRGLRLALQQLTNLTDVFERGRLPERHPRPMLHPAACGSPLTERHSIGKRRAVGDDATRRLLDRRLLA
jgi:hypothetical protein